VHYVDRCVLMLERLFRSPWTSLTIRDVPQTRVQLQVDRNGITATGFRW